MYDEDSCRFDAKGLVLRATMKTCCVEYCTNSSIDVEKKNVTHIFPSNMDLRNKWIQSLGLRDLDVEDHNVVCSAHFRDGTDFHESDEGTLVLRDGAIPEIRACRVCLAMNVKLYHLTDFSLHSYYEQITGLSLKSEDQLPKMLCWECTGRLRSAISFKEKALNTHSVLSTKSFIGESVIERIKQIHKNTLKSTLTQKKINPNDFDLLIIESEAFKSEELQGVESDEEQGCASDAMGLNSMEEQGFISEEYNDKCEEYIKDFEEIDEVIDVKRETLSELNFSFKNREDNKFNRVIISGRNIDVKNVSNVDFKVDAVQANDDDKVFTEDIWNVDDNEPTNKEYFNRLDLGLELDAIEADNAATDSDRSEDMFGVKQNRESPLNNTKNTITTPLMNMRVKHPSSAHTCDLCGLNFVSEKGVERHKSVRHKDDEFKPPKGPFCDTCDIRFVSREAYDTHLRVTLAHCDDVSDRIWKECKNKNGEYFPTTGRKRRWQGNTWKTQGLPEKITCEVCGVELIGTRAYISHFRLHHPLMKRSQACKPVTCICGLCGKPLRVNKQERQFRCEVCCESVPTQDALKYDVAHVSYEEPWPKGARREVRE